MKITIIQKSKYDNAILLTHTYERDYPKEILDIIKVFSDDARDYTATYLDYKIED